MSHRRLFSTLFTAVFMVSSAVISFAAGAQQVKETTASAIKTFKDCADCPEMVVIPPGSFDMGSTVEERTREGVIPKFFDREGPIHRVTFKKAFALARTEVTRGQYAQFVADTKRPDPVGGCGAFNREEDNWHDRPPFSWRNTSFYQNDNHPVACLSWNDANDFVKWFAQKTGKPYRLASEAEWEYAARAGTKTARYWGDSAVAGCKLANFMSAETFDRLGRPKSLQDELVCNSPRSFTQEVGSYPPNPWGLYDMFGNVYELVADCFHPDYNGAPTDGSAWAEPGCKEHMLRGGAYYSAPSLVRAAHRAGPVSPDQHANSESLRLARDLP